jgi:hypothetical protein
MPQNEQYIVSPPENHYEAKSRQVQTDVAAKRRLTLCSRLTLTVYRRRNHRYGSGYKNGLFHFFPQHGMTGA